MSKITLIKLGFYALFITVLVLCLMQFLSVNQTEVTINTYFGPLHGLGVGKVIVIAFLGGGLVGFVAAFLPSLIDLMKLKRMQIQLITQKKRITELEKKQSSMLAHADLPGEEL